MATSEQLRKMHADMQLNQTSKSEDKQIASVVRKVCEEIIKEFNIKITWEKAISLTDVVRTLRKSYPSVGFADPEVQRSFMSPDGGIVYLVSTSGEKYPILISEVKNQGTNDLRKAAGLRRQAKGNAIERLGKNVIGLRAYMLSESIFPFVCFGDGCDFEKGSSILDRVLTISMFGELNADHTANEGPNGCFNRGSYYFRYEHWTQKEMYDILLDVARRSVYYYFSKYGDTYFLP